MDGVKLSVGYDGKVVSLKAVLDSSDKIAKVYTGGLPGRIHGGRRQYLERLDVLEEQCTTARDKGIHFALTLNASAGVPDSCDKVWWHATIAYLKAVEALGVDGVIVSHPFLISAVKSHTSLKVTASTIANITTARMAAQFEKLGADVIVPSMNVNLRPQVLGSMRKALKTAVIELMVNEHCIADCPWREAHYIHVGLGRSAHDFHVLCKKEYLKAPYLLVANNVIRPEDLIHYMGITDTFKIVGRDAPLEDTLRRVRAYSEGRYEGNYLDLSDDKQLARIFYIDNRALDDLWKVKSVCSQVCDSCHVCDDYLQRGLVRPKPMPRSAAVNC